MLALASLLALSATVQAAVPIAATTSGLLFGTETNGVNIFKGIRFGQPPVGNLRFAPPVPFLSGKAVNATTLPPSCLQQFTFATQALAEALFNTPGPPSENEDCLFLNVWAPAKLGAPRATVVWFFGGSHEFGSGSVPTYDGTNMAANQDIIQVTFNYRTNVFGFPVSPDLPLKANNLGYFDQELALTWVRDNIAAFGGDPFKVAIMGQSAGSQSVSDAFTRHSQFTAPFRAAIMFSGASTSRSPAPDFTNFNQFATAVGCTQSPGAARLACLRKVPAATIHAFVNGPTSGAFGNTVVDNVTVFDDPLNRIRTGLTARVPFVIGSMENDGTVFAVGDNNLTAFVGSVAAANGLRALYPADAASDNAVISDVIRDEAFRCPASLWTAAAVGAGIENVFRYSYGAVFPQFQVFPNAGAWHSTELPLLFNNLNATGVTPGELVLEKTWQTAIATFIKNPNEPFATNWPRYKPGNNTQTLAKLAYNGNFEPGNFVQAVTSDSLDGPCELVFDAEEDFRPGATTTAA